MLFAASLVPSWLNECCASPAAVRLGWVCLHSLWQCAAVAAALAVALRVIPRQSSTALATRYRLAAVILWPAAAVVGMTPSEIDAILAHELAHVRRRDALMNLLQACIDVLFFHHPAAWWISRQVGAEREYCADDLAVRALEAGRAGTRLSYTRALLALEERRQTVPLAVASNGGRLLDRIRRLAGHDAEPAGTARLLAASLTATALLAIAVSFAAIPRPATADELPKDTNTIESLSPEQARKLVQEFQGVVVDTYHACLPLNGVQSLNAEAARALAGYDKGPLLLNGLTTLDADTARALAEFKGHWLHLDGLTTLDADAARALFGGQISYLSLGKLERLDAHAAAGLATFKGHGLFLDGLRALDVHVARALVNTTADRNYFLLSLKGVSTLDATTAAVVANVRVAHLMLDGLRSLDAATARKLVTFKDTIGLLSLGGITAIDADTATALAKFKGQHLGLDGLTTLDTDAARELVKFKGGLFLRGLTTLEPDTAKALSAFHARSLNLGGLPSLDPAAAKTLAGFKGDSLSLDGLTTLSTEVAHSLASFKGHSLHLSGVKAIDADAATALAGFSGARPWLTALLNDRRLVPGGSHEWTRDEISLGLTTLDADVARALAAFPGQQLSLNALKSLSADAARALAEFNGEGIMLHGLTTLDKDVATGLGGFRGQWLSIHLEEFDPDVAEILTALQGDGPWVLFLKRLSARAADKLVQSPRWQGHLGAVTSFDIEAVQVLAKAQRKWNGRTDALTTLDAETAKAFVAAPQWDGQLPALTTLDSPDSVATAQALAMKKGPLQLPNLKKISPKTLAALLEKEDVEIPLIETLELIPEPDGSPTEDFVIPEEVRERQQR